MPFRPRVSFSLLMLSLASLCAWLGLWQLDRMQAKQTLIDRFENAPDMSINRALSADVPFARVRASGHYETDWQLLLDNKMLGGRPGVHVLHLFHTTEGQHVLVNRGWLPMAADRRSLPAIDTPGDKQEIAGLLRLPSADGVRLGQADSLESLSGPTLITYLDLPALASSLDVPLVPRLLLLDAASPNGFEGRQWQAAVMLPKQHGAYAVQWFGLAAGVLLTWLILTYRKGRNPRSSSTRTTPENR